MLSTNLMYFVVILSLINFVGGQSVWSYFTLDKKPTEKNNFPNDASCSNHSCSHDCRLNSFDEPECFCQEGYEVDGNNCKLIQTSTENLELTTNNTETKYNNEQDYNNEDDDDDDGDSKVKNNGNIEMKELTTVMQEITEQPTTLSYKEESSDVENIKENDSHDGGEAMLYYTSKNEVRAYSLGSKSTPVVIINVGQAPSAVALNNGDLFWSVKLPPGREYILKSNSNGKEAAVFVDSDLRNVVDMEVDWITGNVYYVDETQRHVGVVAAYGSYPPVRLVTKNIYRPRGIALNPDSGTMYWTDRGEGQIKARISRASMDGSKQNIFISTDIQFPNDLTIDHQDQKLFWIDSMLHTLNSINLDGTSRSTIRTESGYMYAIAVHKNRLYWSDWSQKSINSCDKNTGGDVEIEVQGQLDSNVYGMAIYDPTFRNSSRNPCASQLCDDICLISDHISSDKEYYSCACFGRRTLLRDGKSCGELEMLMMCSSNEFRCQSGACISRNLVCNGFKDCPDSSDELSGCIDIKTVNSFQQSEETKNNPLSWSGMDCTVDNLKHNYLMVKDPVYDIDDGTTVPYSYKLSTQNVWSVNVGPDEAYGSAYLDQEKNLVLKFKRINEFAEHSRSKEYYYYNLTLQLECTNGKKVKMYTKVPVIDTNTFDPHFKHPQYTYNLISKHVSDFERVYELNKIIATDNDITNGKLEFSISNNEYFDVAYGGVVPNSMGKSHYASLVPKVDVGEIKRNVQLMITAIDTGNPPRQSSTKVNILLPSPATPMFDKLYYVGDYYSNGTFSMQQTPWLNGVQNSNSIYLYLTPFDYFTPTQRGNQVLIMKTKDIPTDIFYKESFMIYELNGYTYGSQYMPLSKAATVVIEMHH